MNKITVDMVKSMTNIHNIPRTITVNRNIVLDPFLYDNLAGRKDLASYDFKVYLEKYKMNLQRPFVWNIIQQQEFILSILLDKPIPPVVVVQYSPDPRSHKHTNLVIDGKQRLLTIKRFINNVFSVNVCGVDVKMVDFDYDLHQFFVSRVNSFVGTVYYSDDEDGFCVTDDMKIILFNYYNFAGTQQEESHKNKLQSLLNNQ